MQGQLSSIIDEIKILEVRMRELIMDRIRQDIRETMRPFFEEIIDGDKNVHSLHLVGSAVTDDYVPGVSDINSIVVLREMTHAFLDRIAPLGKKYRKKGISAPLIMTPDYIHDSLDAFPIEFLNFKLIHVTVFGDDVFPEISIDKGDLRLQCEREIKSKLIWLRQSYISSMGEGKLLVENMANSISGFLPLFRGIIFLMGKEPPVSAHDVMAGLGEGIHSHTGIFKRIYQIKHKQHKPSQSEIVHLFKEYYDASEKIGKIIDDLTV
jgi:hypothetical protein